MNSTRRSPALSQTNTTLAGGSPDITRRKFLAGAGTAALGLTVLKPALVRGADSQLESRHRRHRLRRAGSLDRRTVRQERQLQRSSARRLLPGPGRRGRPEAQRPGEQPLHGLSGYKRLLEQKLDAVAIESPPYFHPEQAAAAVAAGKHVYCAKPMAVDVPGCASIAESGRQGHREEAGVFH